MSGFLLLVFKIVIIDYFFFFELKFFWDIGSWFGKIGLKFVFRFFEKDDVEVLIN